MTTLGTVLPACEARLEAAGICNAHVDAIKILSHVVGIAPEAIETSSELMLDSDTRERLERAIECRERRVPIERIIGATSFYGITVKLAKDVFKPYPETEELVRHALNLLRNRDGRVHILDLGTGTGCVLLALLKAVPSATGVGIDVDEHTIGLARENAALNNLQLRARFRVGDWTRGIQEKFDFIIANPPRTATAEFRYLAPETRRYEPRVAMDGGDDGLRFFHLLAQDFSSLSHPGACGLFQVTSRRAEDVKTIFSRGQVAVHADIMFDSLEKPVAVAVFSRRSDQIGGGG
jgi:release factor glutamine methyltransferase